MKDNILYCPDDCKELIEYMKIETIFFCDKYSVKLEHNSLKPEKCFMCRNNNEKRTAQTNKNS